MKLLLVLALIGAATAGRLENNYLPPSGASHSGGSAGAIQAPYSSNRAQQGQQGGFQSQQGGYKSQQSGFQSQQSGSQSQQGGYKSQQSGFQSQQAQQGGYKSQQGGFQSQQSGFQSQQGSRTSPPVEILKYSNENNGEGTYQYSYETSNGISQSESGYLKNAGNPETEVNVASGSYSFTGEDGVQYTVNWTADENGFRAEGAHLPVAPPTPEAILRSLEQNAAEEARGSTSRGGSSGQQREYLAPQQTANKRPGFSQLSGYNY